MKCSCYMPFFLKHLETYKDKHLAIVKKCTGEWNPTKVQRANRDDCNLNDFFLAIFIS